METSDKNDNAGTRASSARQTGRLRDPSPFTERAILLISAHAELTEGFAAGGARVVICPQVRINPVEDYNALDEAIENLYGYDWLVFVNRDCVEAFLNRFQQAEHGVSELDSIKVCAIGEGAAASLEAAHVHVDVVTARIDAPSVVTALATYLGSVNEAAGLNVLIPQATAGLTYSREEFAEAGVRADSVAAYQTVAEDNSSLVRLQTLLINGGMDCVVFTQESEVEDLARLFGSNDLSQVLRNTTVACLNANVSHALEQFGARTTIRPETSSPQSLVDAVRSYFSR